MRDDRKASVEPAVLQSERLGARIEAALQWRVQSRWPGREADLALAARLLARLGGPMQPAARYARWHGALARALWTVLRARHPPEEAQHRTLLCLLLIQGAHRGVDVNA